MERRLTATTLSVIMPTHNRADVISFAIESVLYQSFQDFELLIVGDGCTDNTAEVVQSFSDPRIQWMDLPKAANYGYANRNIAFRKARGKYIGFMAHDDIILPDHFELMLRHLDKHPELEWIYSRPGWVTRDGLIFGIEFNLLNPSTRIPFLQKRHNALPATCVVHRKSCFEKYGYWNTDLPSCGDWDMWIRIISGSQSRNYDFLPQVSCLHFVAIWKQDINSGLREAKHWRQLYDSMPDIPPVLKRDIMEGQKEQEVIWKEICRDPYLWTDELRAALNSVWDLRVETLVSENGLLAQQIGQLKREVENLTGQLHKSDNTPQNNEQEANWKAVRRLAEDIQEIKSRLSAETEGNQEKLATLEKQVKELRKNLDDVYQSYSWKIGRIITKLIGVFFGWIPRIRR